MGWRRNLFFLLCLSLRFIILQLFEWCVDAIIAIDQGPWANSIYRPKSLPKSDDHHNIPFWTALYLPRSAFACGVPQWSTPRRFMEIVLCNNGNPHGLTSAERASHLPLPFRAAEGTKTGISCKPLAAIAAYAGKVITILPRDSSSMGRRLSRWYASIRDRILFRFNTLLMSRPTSIYKGK